MAVQAKDGSWHHSSSRASLHDEMSSKPATNAPAKKSRTEKPRDGDDEKGTDVSHMEIGEVVKEHGPAHHVVIHHDHAGKLSTVTSHHGEKGKAHMHHSEHDGENHVHEAHGHAMEAAGHDSDGDEEKDEAFEGQETPGEEEAEEEMQGIPGIKS